ncbi:MAG: MATE family efflux transporter [Clostridia bacterium]|nr:MATE family efflux transporter [Clostridia bacterium]
MMNRKITVDFLKGNIIRSLLIFAIPLFISNLFQQLYNTVDVMIVGNILGDTSLAAIGAGTPIYDLMIGFALGMGTGLSIVTARSFGTGDMELLKKSTACALCIGAAISIVITVIAQLGVYPLMALLNTPENIIDEANSYISTLTMFTFVLLAYNLCSGLLRAVGNSVMPMIFLMISSALNIILDYFFIAKVGMGIRGAAVATVISQGLSVILCIIYIGKKCKILIPQKKHFRFGKRLFGDMLTQGFSMGFMHCIVSAGSVVLQSGINGLGYLTIAGHTTARKIFQFCIMPFSSMSLSMSTFVPQNRGAGQWKRIRDALHYTMIYNVVMAAFVTVFLYFAAPILTHWISGSSEPVVLQNSSLYLRVVAPFYAVLGVLNVTRNTLQGMGMKMIPLISSCIELVAKILFAFLLIPIFKYNAVIWCEPVIWCIMTVQLLFSFYRYPDIRAAKK